jgi:lipopolysaccharide transport system ATP-binding protein
MMRLAFAVQTAVEPQILIVDEALAVGDMFFQAKCIARIRKLVGSGVSLLFVSHDITSVRQICRRAVFLDGGVVRSVGEAGKVSDQYFKLQLEDRNSSAVNGGAPKEKSHNASSRKQGTATPRAHVDCPNAQDITFGEKGFQTRAAHNRVSNGKAEIVNVQMLRQGEFSAEFDFDDIAQIRVFVRFIQDLQNLNVSLKIRTLQGTDLVFLDTRLQNEMAHHYEAGKTYLFDWTLKLPLLHGNYALACGLAQPPKIPGADWVFVDIVPHAYEFKISPRRDGMIDGFITLPASLEIREIETSLA